MPTVQQGARGTIDLLEDLVVQEMMRRVAVLETSVRPFTTLLASLEKFIASDTAEPQHAEDEALPTVDLVQGAHTAAAVLLNVDNPAFFLVGDLIHFPRTGEVALVTSAPGVNPLTVRRGIGQMLPAALVDDDRIWIMAGASEEGATSRNALNTLEIPKTSYCQIMRTSIEATGTQLATRQLGGDFEDHTEKALMHHKKGMEYVCKFGRADRITVNGQYMRMTGGLLEAIPGNRFAVDGTLGEGEWEAFGDMAGAYGSARKLGLISTTVHRAVTNFARGRLITVPEDESYGLRLLRYHFSSGLDLDLVVDRELKGSVYGGWGIVVDPNYSLGRYLRAFGGGRSEKYEGSAFCMRVENIQANDADRRKDEFFSELGFQFIHGDRVNAVITGVRG